MSKKKSSRLQILVILGSRAESVAGPMDQPAICLSRSVRSVPYCIRFGQYCSKPLTETNLFRIIASMRT